MYDIVLEINKNNIPDNNIFSNSKINLPVDYCSFLKSDCPSIESDKVDISNIKRFYKIEETNNYSSTTNSDSIYFRSNFDKRLISFLFSRIIELRMLFNRLILGMIYLR